MTKNNPVEKNGNTEPVDKITELYDFMVAQSLEELELKDAAFYLKIKRKSKKIAPPQMFLHAGNIHLPQQVHLSTPVPESAEIVKIKAPLNGLFYRSQSPTMPPFVKEGDIAEAGATLCIVEAMKVMNEIKAETKCRIMKIFIENGQAVNFGQVMFSVTKE